MLPLAFHWVREPDSLVLASPDVFASDICINSSAASGTDWEFLIALMSSNVSDG